MNKKGFYLENYWLLFLDFIDAFRELTYNNIPLPLLANFYQHLDDRIKEELPNADFKKYLTNKSLPDAEVQPQFEQRLKPFKQPIGLKPIKGKVLLNFDYLRFSQDNYIRYFDPGQTVIFARWERDKYLGIPVHCIKKYMVDVKTSVDKIVEKARKIFASVSTHPVFGNQYFMNTFIGKIPQMVETIAAVDKYMGEKTVSCVLVGTTEDLISRVLIIIAAGKGIPSICLQHGLLGGDEAYIPVFSTIVAVYGYYEKDWYLKKGLDENRIAIAGHPRFDDIFNQNHMSKRMFNEKYKLDMKKKTILFITQPNYHVLWNELIELLDRESQVEILIKPHPWEISRDKQAMDIYGGYTRKYNSVRLISEKGVNLYDILPNVDVVISNLSTAGLETMLFKKPLCILSDKHFDYYERMGDYFYSSPSKLAHFVGRLLKNNELKQAVYKKMNEFLAYAYPQKLSGDRLKKVIEKLVSGEGLK